MRLKYLLADFITVSIWTFAVFGFIHFFGAALGYLDWAPKPGSFYEVKVDKLNEANLTLYSNGTLLVNIDALNRSWKIKDKASKK